MSALSTAEPSIRTSSRGARRMTRGRPGVFRAMSVATSPAAIAKSLCGFRRIARVTQDWHRKRRNAQARCGSGHRALDDAIRVREIRDFTDPGGVETKQYATHDIDLLVIVERGAVGDETPNVLARRRVRDNSDQAPLGHGRRIDSSHRLTIEANAGAASTCGTWPTPSMISSQAVGKAVTAATACNDGITW